MNVEISIIIVSFNTKTLLDRCLESIHQYSNGIPLEIITIDNNSGDGSDRMVESKYPGVHLIRNSHNAGFAAANNQGLRRAEGRYVFFLNPDTELFPETLLQLKTFMDDSDAGACGPRTLLDAQSPLSVCSLKILTPQRAKAVFTRLRMHSRNSILKQIWNTDFGVFTARSPIPVEGIGGAAFFTRKEILIRKGGMDCRFFMGYEDTDLAAYFHLKKLPVYYIPDARIVHYFGQARQTAQAPKKTTYSLQKAPARFIRKYYGNVAALSFLLEKTLDKLLPVKRSIARTTLTASRSVPLTIRWSKNRPADCLFEMSNDEPFFDKFGFVTSADFIELPETLLQRLNEDRWFFRVFEIPINPEQPILQDSVQLIP